MPGEISRSYNGPKDGHVPSWLDDEKQVWDGYTMHAGKRHVPQPPTSPPTRAEVVVRLSTIAKFPSIGEYAQSVVCDAITLLLAAPVAWQFRYKSWSGGEWSEWSTLPDNWNGVRNPDYEYRPLYP